MRRIFIIPVDANVEDYTAQAAAANAGEIVSGVPHFLEGIIDEEKLPFVYSEPQEDVVDPGPSLEKRLESLETELVEVKTRARGLEEAVKGMKVRAETASTVVEVRNAIVGKHEV